MFISPCGCWSVFRSISSPLAKGMTCHCCSRFLSFTGHHMSDRVVIVGAGIAGLTLGYKLAQAGRQVLVVEKEKAIGGLARSFRYGEFVFDVGPHRFHTDVPEINAFIREVLAGDCLEIGRRSGVWMFDRYFEWPLTPGSILKMPPSVLLRVGLDLFIGHAGGDVTFEEFVVNRYGTTLYRIFFKPYTEKFLGLPCSEISSEWAVTGIERAVIDKKVDSGDLKSFARSVLTSKSPLQFIYPQSGGIGRFAELLAQGIERLGGEVLAGAEVEQIVADRATVRKVIINDRPVECSCLVWTAPPHQLLSMLGRGTPNLEFLPLLLFNYEISGRPLVDYQWCYYGDENVPFNRVSMPISFNPALAPVGKTGICVEVTGDVAESAEESLDRTIRKALLDVGLVANIDVITTVHVERIANAYPVYRLNYQDEMRKVAASVEAFDNVELLGRTGSFWYNNMDHSIEDSLRLFAKLTHALH